jgi:ribosome-associated protein
MEPLAPPPPPPKPPAPPPPPPAPAPTVGSWTRFHLLSDEALLAQCDVQVHRAGGPGGQHRNKVETAIRLVHTPSGVVAEGKDQRSRTQNMSAALGRLRGKLEVLERPVKKRRPTKPSRGAKERRLGDKKVRAERKQSRRGDHE